MKSVEERLQHARHIVAKYGKQSTAKKDTTPKSSLIGDCLHDVIHEYTGEAPCKECSDEIEKLNAKTVEEVMSEIESLAARITTRASRKAQRWYERAAAIFLPSLVDAVVMGWIVEACERSQRANQ
jgi:ATP-dependent Lon protease